MGLFILFILDGILGLLEIAIIVWAVMSWLVAFNVMNDRHPLVRQIERMLGTGTLVIESAGEHGQLVLKKIPRVEYTQNQLYRIVEELTDGDGIRP